MKNPTLRQQIETLTADNKSLKYIMAERSINYSALQSAKMEVEDKLTEVECKYKELAGVNLDLTDKNGEQLTIIKDKNAVLTKIAGDKVAVDLAVADRDSKIRAYDFRLKEFADTTDKVFNAIHVITATQVSCSSDSGRDINSDLATEEDKKIIMILRCIKEIMLDN
jgi:hypothetical protein